MEQGPTPHANATLDESTMNVLYVDKRFDDIICAAPLSHLSRSNWPELGEEVVRRWNSHNELLEALELSKLLMASLCDHLQGGSCDLPIYADALSRLEIAEAAIAKARGTK